MAHKGLEPNASLRPILKVDTITELRGQGPQQSFCYFVRGHSEGGDGGAGVFKWSESDPNNNGDDDGVVIKGAGGWWVRANFKLKPELFGGRGDATSSDPTNNCLPIQRCLNIGGKIYFDGLYYVSAHSDTASRMYEDEPILTIERDGTQLIGTQGSRLIMDCTSGERMKPLYAFAKRDIKIENLAIQGHPEEDAANQHRTSGLHFERCERLQFHNMELNTLSVHSLFLTCDRKDDSWIVDGDPNSAKSVSNNLKRSCKNVRVSRCDFKYTINSAIMMLGVQGAHIHWCNQTISQHHTHPFACFVDDASQPFLRSEYAVNDDITIAGWHAPDNEMQIGAVGRIDISHSKVKAIRLRPYNFVQQYWNFGPTSDRYDPNFYEEPALPLKQLRRHWHISHNEAEQILIRASGYIIVTGNTLLSGANNQTLIEVVEDSIVWSGDEGNFGEIFDRKNGQRPFPIIRYNTLIAQHDNIKGIGPWTTGGKVGEIHHMTLSIDNNFLEFEGGEFEYLEAELKRERP